jgi:hypothetical protein
VSDVEVPTLDGWMDRRAAEREKRRMRTKLRMIEGGASAKAPEPVVKPTKRDEDPLTPQMRKQAAQVVRGIVASTEATPQNVAASLLSSAEWALAAKMSGEEFMRFARREYIKAQARRKPGPARK